MRKGETPDNIPDNIDVKCSGWRSWERLVNEVLDWQGVKHVYGGGHADFSGHSDFSVCLRVETRYARKIYERIKKYPGAIKCTWRSSFLIVGQFG